MPIRMPTKASIGLSNNVRETAVEKSFQIHVGETKRLFISTNHVLYCLAENYPGYSPSKNEIFRKGSISKYCAVFRNAFKSTN